ncbi:MAG: hypothetical protein K2J63_07085, partial [Muribaculaceae bacterium]|nr:hypothetical protein [Muribaculaceae bacterium]
IARMFVDAGIWLSFGATFNDKSVGIVPSGMLLAETDESEVSIEDVLTKLSVLSGRDVKSEIERDSLVFLGLDKPQDNLES